MSGSEHEDLKQLLRDGDVARRLLAAIRAEAASLDSVRLMEVCGTHTMAIRRAGIPGLLPANIELLSGPGCPVCVTPNRTVDHAIALARLPELTLLTFGDMIRVPGSSSSLERARSEGADVRVVYSPLDAVRFAREHRDREVVFLGVGFETTAPTVAAAVQEAAEGPANFSVLCAHKLIPPALTALCGRDDFRVDGFICPGHVSTIIGSEAYRPVAERFGIPCVVAGFEPVDVLLCLAMLLRLVRAGRAEVGVEYRAAVRPEGNPHGLALTDRVFRPVTSEWRGLGSIDGSGLAFRDAYTRLDAAARHPVDLPEPREHAGCRCGQVLVGSLRPDDCPLFGEACTPATPVGPCMVSSEGTCAAHFKYRI